MNFFEITHKEKHTRARTGTIHTDHGDIETPTFMPVGTQASVKSLDSADLESLGAQVILGNTYHLHLRPGEDVIARAGGLHRFMNWYQPILTDSGGFQVFSLGEQKKEGEKFVKIDEEGVTFRSYIDGSTHRFTPETAIEIEHKLGADIIMAFDECTPDDADPEYAKAAMERTHRWAKRCLQHHLSTPAPEHSSTPYRQFLFGIVQGANHRELREESARVISSLDFDGIAIGGESIGYNMEATKNILDWVYPLIPENKPHYAMGLGFSPLDLFDVVERGIDMFDCVSPTRMARNGTLFIKNNKNFRINITNATFKEDKNPIDPTCTCSTCQNYSRAYLHHLFDANELSAYRLATIHNLHFFLSLMRDIRSAIRENRLLELKKEWR
ncbi:MAG: tRNA guanosine(34) transglycosylase Tgt [Patescibacteria group bacterium]